ncbi:MAG: hypothetical protein Q4D38_06510 [Planctomycetia bacterium]|nr:hypothetical protein [Planctomycetia bacterium]
MLFSSRNFTLAGVFSLAICSVVLPDCFFADALSGGASVSAQEISLADELEKKAAEIVPLLGDTCGLIPSVDDRAFWEGVAKHPAFKNIVKRAEQELEKPIPTVPDELYLEFSQNGNRSRYQNAYSRRNVPLRFLVYAECIENQGRFLPRIEEHLRIYAEDKSWVLPAHDRGLQNFKGSYDIDLVSSATAWELAVLGNILGEKLSPEARQLLDEQLRIRCFEPYKNSILTGAPKMWWIRGRNNWNAVCLAGVTGAALAHIESKEERAWFVAAALKFIQYSNEGYTNDGYCSEGVSYWNYGFGNHIRLSETLRRATNGKVRILDDPKLFRVASYGFSIEILPGFSPGFADCGIWAAPDPTLLAYLNRYYQIGRNEYDATLDLQTSGLVDFGVFSLCPKADELAIGGSTEARETWNLPKVGLRSWYPDAQVLVCRPAGWEKATPLSSNVKTQRENARQIDGLAVAMKAGHNAELHNHNDVGAYVVVYRGTLPCLDLGGEVYTRRTFSSGRYVSDILNSWGHNVPIVAGQLQKTGRAYAAKNIRTEFSTQKDTFAFELQDAYAVPECRLLTRTFSFDRSGTNAFVVEDRVEFASPQTFETALTTLVPWKLDGRDILLGEGDATLCAKIEVEIDGTPSDAWTHTDAGFEADFSNKKYARRLGIVLNQPVRSATVRVIFAPEK